MECVEGDVGRARESGYVSMWGGFFDDGCVCVWGEGGGEWGGRAGVLEDKLTQVKGTSVDNFSLFFRKIGKSCFWHL